MPFIVIVSSLNDGGWRNGVLLEIVAADVPKGANNTDADSYAFELNTILRKTTLTC